MADVWNDPAPAETIEGVSEPNQPAAPSEVVETPSIETEPAKEPTVETASVPEPAKDEAAAEVPGETTPETSDVKREARRVFMEVQKMGGEEIVKSAVDLATAMQDQSLNAEARVQKLYQTSPRAYEQIRGHLIYSYWDSPAGKDHLLQESFGQGVTAEKVKQLLAGGQIAPSPTPEQPKNVSLPTEEELANMNVAEVAQRFKDVTEGHVPESVKQKLQRLDELEKEFPELKSKVSSFAEQQEAAREQQTKELGMQFVAEAMSPVERMMKEAGLEVLPDDLPQEKAWKEEVWDTIKLKTYQNLTQSPENKSLADDVELFLSKSDKTSAWSKMRIFQARAEMTASRLIAIYTSNRQKQRESQTSNLGKDHPPVITGGQASFGTPPPLPTGRDVWNDSSDQERWKEIAQSVA